MWFLFQAPIVEESPRSREVNYTRNSTKNIYTKIIHPEIQLL